MISVRTDGKQHQPQFKRRLAPAPIFPNL